MTQVWKHWRADARRGAAYRRRRKRVRQKLWASMRQTWQRFRAARAMMWTYCVLLRDMDVVVTWVLYAVAVYRVAVEAYDPVYHVDGLGTVRIPI